jgi:uncharacterized repeat protein (TIGR04138 family)
MAGFLEIDYSPFEGKRYRPCGYEFVLQALGFTIHRLGKRRHVSGQELLAGILEHAREKYGPFGAEVFLSWGVRETLDFGEIVWDLIDMKLLSRREEDHKEDFRSSIDLREYYEEGHDYLSSFDIVKDSIFPHALPKEDPGNDSAATQGSVSFGSETVI